MKKILIILTVAMLYSCNSARVRNVQDFSIVKNVEINYNFEKAYFVETDNFNFYTKEETKVGDTIIIKKK